MTTATKAGGAVLPVVAYEAAWLGDDHMVSRSNIWSGPVHKLVRLSDAQATIDELRAEVERLTKERDAAFAMSRCECAPDEACANLVALKAKQIDVEAVMRLANEYAETRVQVSPFSSVRFTEPVRAAREALRACLLGDGGTL